MDARWKKDASQKKNDAPRMQAPGKKKKKTSGMQRAIQKIKNTMQPWKNTMQNRVHGKTNWTNDLSSQNSTS